MSRVLTGPRAVTEALRANADQIHALYIQRGSRKALANVVREAEGTRARIVERSAAELDALARGHKHQGVVAIAGDYEYASLEEILAGTSPRTVVAPPLLIALDQVTDPHNFGAIVRSAVAFGADGVLTLKDRAAPVTPVVVRASAGATEHAKIARVTNLSRTLAALTKDGMDAIGLDASGELDITDLPPAPGGRVIVVGAEGKGLRRLVRERCTFLARITQPGPIESLNASVAASIALFSASTRR